MLRSEHVSVLIPAYNEGASLERHVILLASTLRRDCSECTFEFIIVDDGSTDDTYAAAERLARRFPNVLLQRHERNRGLGAALRTGFAAAHGTTLITYDADLSYEPDTITRMLNEMQFNRADLVLASPYMRDGSVANVPWLRRVLSREANRILSFAVNGRLATLTCLVRAYRKSLLDRISSNADGMEVNAELAFAALNVGASVKEIPAQLRWSAERASGGLRLRFGRTIAQIANTIACGVRQRPSLLLALPGLAPGVLPLAVSLALVLHASAQTTIAVTTVTIAVQTASLLFFTGQLAAFFLHGPLQALRVPKKDAS